MVIDGFKSYAQRTEINGFDPLFNAITGLNGSGKSNILDAICFLLGISNLSQVCGSLVCWVSEEEKEKCCENCDCCLSKTIVNGLKGVVAL